jgi:hypothetical protein
MGQRYAFVLSRNTHKKAVDRDTGIEQELWHQTEPFHETLEHAKAAAGDAVEWRDPVPLRKPGWAQDGPWGNAGTNWLQQYSHFSVDNEWHILQYGVEDDMPLNPKRNESA